MRVLVVENDRVTELGNVAVALTEAGAGIVRCRPHTGQTLPAGHDGFDALVVMGGAQSAVDDAAHPYLPVLAALMRAFGDAGKSVLGICLGSQLLARGYGGENRIGQAREFGWCEVRLTPEGKADPVAAAAPAAFRIFHWHNDTFTLPDDAVLLATNGTVANQAFRIGRAVYGMQFHFEASRAVVDHWAATFPEQIERMSPGWLAARASLAAEKGPSADAAGLALARAWVATIKADAAGDSRQAKQVAAAG